MSARRLVVTRTWEIAKGEKNGKPWTLFGIEANDTEGQAIPVTLKSFSSLARGEVDVEVEVQESAQYGTSYMLKPVGGGGGGGGGAGGHELGELLGRVERLESEVRRLSSLLDRREDPTPRAAPVAAGIPDDDIPF